MLAKKPNRPSPDWIAVRVIVALPADHLDEPLVGEKRASPATGVVCID